MSYKGILVSPSLPEKYAPRPYGAKRCSLKTLLL